ncbi:hypothetical protein QFC20_002694 [Naganishia adeliensis]|uniref:Uncharacterized protein n=1 Tax=Naganishia adeliensis TaxID=92952 RepID=A0ACC2WIM4_9TREE|nr:hypothetical protein QFC20_002694 [Naganishia adeliensis]
MSSLLHTAINNRQAAAHPRDSPGKKLAKLSLASDEDTDEGNGDFPETYDEDEDDDEMVDLQTRPGTPVPGGVKSVGMSSGSGLRSLSGKLTTSRDPLRILPSALAVRVFLQLDIKSLARCNRVCKRWRKSSTLNYTWFLHCRSLTLPKPTTTRRKLLPAEPDPDDPNSGFDPYDKYRGLPQLATPVPASSTPQWSKRESKKEWRPIFQSLATRTDTDAEKRDSLQVDIDALSATVSPGGSGYSTPTEAAGSGGAVTPAKSKKEMRAHYKSLGGRKSKAKGMLGGTPRGHKDLGGAGEAEDRFSSPF